MGRRSSWIFLALVVFVISSGTAFYFSSFDSLPRGGQSPEKPVESFLPEDLSAFARLDVTSRTARRLRRIPLVEALRASRFPHAFRERLLPILTFATNRIKANRPFPSRFLLRYLDGTSLHLFRERGGRGVGVVDFSRFGGGRPPAEVRGTLRGWLVQPARRHSFWSVEGGQAAGVPLWTLRRRVPAVDTEVSFSLGTVGSYLLVALERGDLVRALRRFRDASVDGRGTEPSIERSEPVVFAYGSNLLERLTAGDTLPTTMDSATPGGAGRVTLADDRLNLDVRVRPEPAPFDTGPGVDTDPLRYHSPDSTLVLQVGRYRDGEGGYLKRWSGSLFPSSLEDLLEPLNRSLIESRSVSVQHSAGRPQGASSSLLVLDVSNRRSFERSLREQSSLRYGPRNRRIHKEESTGAYHVRWHGDRLLISADRSVPIRAVERYRSGEGFVDRLRREGTVHRTRRPYRLMAYASTARFLENVDPRARIPGEWLERVRWLLGFDPVAEARRVTRDLPGSILVVRRQKQGTLNAEMVSSGDPLLAILAGRSARGRREEFSRILRSFYGQVRTRLKDSLLGSP